MSRFSSPKKVQELGSRVRQLRIALRYSMRDVANELGVSATTVSNWEHGKATPEAHRLPLLALTLHTTEAYLRGQEQYSEVQPAGSDPAEILKNAVVERARRYVADSIGLPLRAVKIEVNPEA